MNISRLYNICLTGKNTIFTPGHLHELIFSFWLSSLDKLRSHQNVNSSRCNPRPSQDAGQPASIGEVLKASAKVHLCYVTGYIRKFPKVTALSQFETLIKKTEKTSTGEKNRWSDDKCDGYDLPNGEAPFTAPYSPSGVYVSPAVCQHCGLGDYNIHCIRKHT